MNAATLNLPVLGRAIKQIVSILFWTVLSLLIGFFVIGYFVLNVTHIPCPPVLTYAMFAAHWLITIAACGLAIRWSFSSPPQRFYLSLVLSVLALASSSWGLACIRLTITQTTNGRFSDQFDSNWFFTASVILAALALVFTVWRKRRSTGLA